MSYLDGLKEKAEAIKADTYALYLAVQDPRVPWYAKALLAVVVAYALSPIDLIPDFIPVLGYLDDLLIVPAGLALVVKLVPPQVMKECREKADQIDKKGPSSMFGLFIVVIIWLLAAAAIWTIALKLWSRPAPVP